MDNFSISVASQNQGGNLSGIALDTELYNLEMLAWYEHPSDRAGAFRSTYGPQLVALLGNDPGRLSKAFEHFANVLVRRSF